MDIGQCIKETFCVIGKEGSTNDGEGFVSKLWEEANGNYAEIEGLVKIDEDGIPAGFWGAMSDMGRKFKPWENDFSKGLYLAGAEVVDDAVPPIGWVKWTIPSYEYLYVKVEDEVSNVFPLVLKYIEENNLELVGAIHDYMCPREDGQLYMFFPIKEI